MPTTRSPKYPAIGLPTALERAKILFDAHQQNPAAREIVARGMGFNKLHGKSRSCISALGQYGLLEKADGELRISELAMKCLFPQSGEEQAEAVRQAACSPGLFHALQEKYSSSLPTEEIISSWLVRQRFSPAGAKLAANAYLETMEHVESPLADNPPEESTTEPAEDETETSPDRTQESTSSVEEKLAPGRFQVTADENSLVSIQAVRLDREKVEKLRDMLDHLLGSDFVSNEALMLPHED